MKKVSMIEFRMVTLLVDTLHQNPSLTATDSIYLFVDA